MSMASPVFDIEKDLMEPLVATKFSPCSKFETLVNDMDFCSFLTNPLVLLEPVGGLRGKAFLDCFSIEFSS